MGRGSAMSTPLHPSAKRHPLDDEDDYQTPGQSSRSRYKRPKRESSLNRSTGQRLVLKTKSEYSPEAASPAPPGAVQPMVSRFITEPSLSQHSSSRRPRPLTQHQLAVEQYRRQRIEYLLNKRKTEAYRILRAKRETENPFVRYGQLLQSVPDGYDTEDEEVSWGKGGLLPNPNEHEDFGECANYFLSVIRKATRRLDRWDYENANGPKRDRKREREERQRTKVEMFAIDDLDFGPGRPAPSARSRQRAARNAKRKAEAAAAAAAGSKGDTAATASHATNDGPAHGHTPGGSGKAGPDLSKDGDDGLDDIDRELLGEATDDDDEHHGPRPYQRTGPGYEESYVGEPLSSDDTDEEDLDDGEGEGEGEGDADGHVAGEGYDNSSTYEGGESSSVAGGDPEADAHAARSAPAEQRPGPAGEVAAMGGQ